MSTEFRVLITDKISDSGLEPQRGDSRFELIKIDDSSEPAFNEALPTVHGLIVRSATKVHAEMLEKATELRVVGRAGVGVDNIDLEAATARGVAVLNAPAGNTVSAAELTLALILSMVRRVVEADASVRRREWARSRFKGAELRGRILGLVGAGRIGGEVAKRCRAFGMRVIAYDPYLTDERAEDTFTARPTHGRNPRHDRRLCAVAHEEGGVPGQRGTRRRRGRGRARDVARRGTHGGCRPRCIR